MVLKQFKLSLLGCDFFYSREVTAALLIASQHQHWHAFRHLQADFIQTLLGMMVVLLN